MPTIIYPPSIPWNWMFQRPQQIMRQLAVQGYTVLYEDLGDFPAPGVKKLSNTFNLCQGISSLSIPHSRPRILWLSVPSHINLIDQYDPDLVIYDAVDEPKEEFASWAPYYPAILEKAHLIFTSAKSIYDHLSSIHPNVNLVPNGVDNVHFSAPRIQKPADLPTGKPIVGYSGAIAPWVDWDLLTLVIKDNPQIQFVFIGTLFQMRNFPLKMSNVKYLGLKHYAQLPAYLQNFTVGIIPFRITEMTKGCNPIKLYEYYAIGLPVMATPLPELISVPKIYLDNDPTRFSLRLGQIVQKGDLWKSQRLAYAQSNDWAERTNQISSHIQKSLLNFQAI
jgi:glycosyltransferase involved in cell wall biosynthesis